MSRGSGRPGPLRETPGPAAHSALQPAKKGQVGQAIRLPILRVMPFAGPAKRRAGHPVGDGRRTTLVAPTLLVVLPGVGIRANGRQRQSGSGPVLIHSSILTAASVKSVFWPNRSVWWRYW
jgi:hypothetical protein